MKSVLFIRCNNRVYISIYVIKILQVIRLIGLGNEFVFLFEKLLGIISFFIRSDKFIRCDDYIYIGIVIIKVTAVLANVWLHLYAVAKNEFEICDEIF